MIWPAVFLLLPRSPMTVRVVVSDRSGGGVAGDVFGSG
jgi:hypothetical protein